jgi:hypothetical protein
MITVCCLLLVGPCQQSARTAACSKMDMPLREMLATGRFIYSFLILPDCSNFNSGSCRPNLRRPASLLPGLWSQMGLVQFSTDGIWGRTKCRSGNYEDFWME